MADTAHLDLGEAGDDLLMDLPPPALPLRRNHSLPASSQRSTSVDWDAPDRDALMEVLHEASRTMATFKYGVSEMLDRLSALECLDTYDHCESIRGALHAIADVLTRTSAAGGRLPASHTPNQGHPGPHDVVLGNHQGLSSKERERRSAADAGMYNPFPEGGELGAAALLGAAAVHGDGDTAQTAQSRDIAQSAQNQDVAQSRWGAASEHEGKPMAPGPMAPGPMAPGAADDLLAATRASNALLIVARERLQRAPEVMPWLYPAQLSAPVEPSAASEAAAASAWREDVCASNVRASSGRVSGGRRSRSPVGTDDYRFDRFDSMNGIAEELDLGGESSGLSSAETGSRCVAACRGPVHMPVCTMC